MEPANGECLSGGMDVVSDIVANFDNLWLSNEDEEEEEEEEDVAVAIPWEELEGEINQCKRSLAAKILTERPFNVKTAIRDLKAAWSGTGTVEAREGENGRIIFQFQTQKGLEWVLHESPWHFSDYLVLLRRWEPNLDLINAEVELKQSFWIQIHDLGFEYLNAKVAKLIGERIGVLEEVDEDVLQTSPLRGYLRLRVEIDVRKPLRRVVKLKGIDGNVVWAELRYERLPMFCGHCGIISHDKKNCKQRLKDIHAKKTRENQADGYGAWLRAEANPNARRRSPFRGGDFRRREEEENSCPRQQAVDTQMTEREAARSDSGTQIVGNRTVNAVSIREAEGQSGPFRRPNNGPVIVQKYGYTNGKLNKPSWRRKD